MRRITKRVLFFTIFLFFLFPALAFAPPSSDTDPVFWSLIINNSSYYIEIYMHYEVDALHNMVVIPHTTLPPYHLCPPPDEGTTPNWCCTLTTTTQGKFVLMYQYLYILDFRTRAEKWWKITKVFDESTYQPVYKWVIENEKVVALK